jgi:hypothetical protein
MNEESRPKEKGMRRTDTKNPKKVKNYNIPTG